MLFIMINQQYPFDRKQPKDVMAQQQWRKDYHLQPTIEQKVSIEIRHLITITLEPDETLRPDIWTVCRHPFFPSVHQEDEDEMLQVRKKKMATKDDSSPGQV